MSYKALFRTAIPAVAFAFLTAAHAQQPNIYEELAKLLPKIERLGFRGMTCFRTDIRESGAMPHIDTYCGDVSTGHAYVIEREFYDPVRKTIFGQRACLYDSKKPDTCSGPSKNITLTTFEKRLSSRGKRFDFDFRRYKDDYEKREKLLILQKK